MASNWMVSFEIRLYQIQKLWAIIEMWKAFQLVEELMREIHSISNRIPFLQSIALAHCKPPPSLLVKFRKTVPEYNSKLKLYRHISEFNQQYGAYDAHIFIHTEHSVKISARSVKRFTVMIVPPIQPIIQNRRKICCSKLSLCRDHSAKISAQSIQPFRRSLRGRKKERKKKKKKKQESAIKAYNLPAVSASCRPAALLQGGF